MPKRVSSLSTDIEQKKVLQDEQVRLASGAIKYLLYYISGGNVDPGFKVADKVRTEDGDLRGWFTEAYGSDYLNRLTNTDLANYLFTSTMSNSDRVAKIKADFETNDYGYIMRVGAVNDYHIGRIITQAANMTKHQNEARNYAKELAILSAKLLFSGQAPNNNIFDILHSSISVWYGTQGKDLPVQLMLTLAASRVIEQNKSDGTKVYPEHNHTKYAFELICALFDMHCFSLRKDIWVVDANVKSIVEALDGVTETDLNNDDALLKRLNQESDTLDREIKTKKNLGHDQPPIYTEEIRNKWVNSGPYGAVMRLAWTAHEEAGLKVGDQLPRGIPLSAGIFAGGTGTDDYYVDYDAYIKLKNSRDAKQVKIQEMVMKIQSLEAKSQPLSDWHKTPAVEITKLITDGVDRSAWLNYIYDTVKTQYGLNYVQKEYGVPSQPYPRLLIPSMPSQTIGAADNLNSIDISRLILFYGKALQGVTPTAYWSTSLSYRLIAKVVSNGSPAQCEVYLHKANMKTGGITGNSGVLIAKIQGDINAAKVLVSSYLPDIPFYSPGTNPVLSSQLKDTFVTKIQSDPTLSQWLKSPMKDQYNYAYIIESAWDPQIHAPTHLLGTRAGSRQTGSYDTHIDWLRATTYAGQNHKKVTTFKPSQTTLSYSPFGVKQDTSQFLRSSSALSATRMLCIGFPNSAISNIISFMKSVPTQIVGLLAQVTDKRNAPWYDAKLRLRPNELYGKMQTIQEKWPEYRDDNGTFALNSFLNDMELLRTFLFNRTESLFISDPNTVVETAYNDLADNKPDIETTKEQKYVELTKTYDVTNFGTTDLNPYRDYMALLGAIAYFNSFEMLTDVPAHRNYAPWAKPFKTAISSIVDTVLNGAVPHRIYQDNINDTEDVSNLHKILQSLGTFEGMSEMPVFDVEKFHVTWTPITPQPSPARDSPFDKQGLVDVPIGGLTPRAFKSLKGQYGDVFYHVIFDTCILRPKITHKKENGYVYSSLRVPVSTRGVSSQVYGLRPGVPYSLEPGSPYLEVNQSQAGSGSITNAGLAGITGLAFAGVIGYHMVKNIASETAFDDKRFRFDDAN